MTSPCSSPSPALLSSPSSPIAEVSSQSGSISQTPCSSRSRKTSCRRICVCCSDGEQPSTSTSQQIHHTAQKVQQAIKRSLSSDDSNAEEPRKKKCKTKHLESSSGSTSTSVRKRKRELSSSSNSSNEGKKHRPSEPTWRRASRYCHTKFLCHKGTLNAAFLEKLQLELYQAQQSLDTDDRLLASIFQESANENNDSREPIVLLNRLSGEPTRLRWKKLAKALTLLETRSRRGAVPLGEQCARNSIKWLQYYFKVLHPKLRTRTLISGISFTRLCAQAITAQNQPLTQTNSNQVLSDFRGHPCFLSHSDFEQALTNPEHLHSECAVSFLRQRMQQKNNKSSHHSTYPVVDFDAEASTSSTSSSQSKKETE